MEFLVDKFHIKGHTTPAYDVLKPDCLYHPDLDKFKEMHGVNTECAEQCFAWLGKFKHCMKYMTQHKFKFFLHYIVASRNRRLEGKLTLLWDPVAIAKLLPLYFFFWFRSCAFACFFFILVLLLYFCFWFSYFVLFLCFWSFYFDYFVDGFALWFQVWLFFVRFFYQFVSAISLL